ncbi:TerC family protein [Methylolobus aquaticus]|nr:TerC family protein [Methylolobus aquaticus]
MPDVAADLNFWIGLGQIILVNIVLSGDNAVVIALAARSLPATQRKLAVIWGSGAAVVMRIVLTLVALELLRQPYLKLIGSGLLFWIALQLMLPAEDGTNKISPRDHLFAAIRTILLADLLMSLDNVIAVAAAAKGDMNLLIIGLAISIPLVIFGSTLVLRLMDRVPIVIELGAALLGFVAGEMLVTDPALEPWFETTEVFWLADLIPLVAAILVIVGGLWLAGRRKKLRPRELVDLAEGEQSRTGR